MIEPNQADPSAAQAQGVGAGGFRGPLFAAVATTALVTALSYFLPDNFAATGVGLGFLAATYWLALRRESDPAQYGLSLGGLLESRALVPRRLLSHTLQPTLWAFGLALLIFPAFWFGWLSWWKPNHGFSATFPPNLWDEALGQLLVIALPEEAFYRGYLQSALDKARSPKVRFLGAQLGWGVLISSALFALGHLATDVNPNRLAVFFPALVFGYLRARTGGVGAGIVFHALCNIFATFLARSYGFAN